MTLRNSIKRRPEPLVELDEAVKTVARATMVLEEILAETKHFGGPVAARALTLMRGLRMMGDYIQAKATSALSRKELDILGWQLDEIPSSFFTVRSKQIVRYLAKRYEGIELRKLLLEVPFDWWALQRALKAIGSDEEDLREIEAELVKLKALCVGKRYVLRRAWVSSARDRKAMAIDYEGAPLFSRFPPPQG